MRQPVHDKGTLNMLYTLFTKPLSKVTYQLRAHGLMMTRTNLLVVTMKTNTCYWK